MWFYQQSSVLPPNPKMSLNVLFCPQTKDIQFTVTVEEKKPEHFHIQEAGNERILTFIVALLFQVFVSSPRQCSLSGWHVIDWIVYWLINKKSGEKPKSFRSTTAPECITIPPFSSVVCVHFFCFHTHLYTPSHLITPPSSFNLSFSLTALLESDSATADARSDIDPDQVTPRNMSKFGTFLSFRVLIPWRKISPSAKKKRWQHRPALSASEGAEGFYTGLETKASIVFFVGKFSEADIFSGQEACEQKP